MRNDADWLNCSRVALDVVGESVTAAEGSMERRVWELSAAEAEGMAAALEVGGAALVPGGGMDAE